MKASGPSIRVARNERTGEMERIICRNAPVRRETAKEKHFRHLDQPIMTASIASKMGTVNKDLVPGKARFIKDPLSR